jgi:hypothetical protein
MGKIRTSAELHPGGCRLVAVDQFVSRRSTEGKDARVRAFVSWTGDTGDQSALGATLQRARHERKLPRDLWVTVWGLRVVHQLLRLPPANLDAVESLARREARKDLAALETDGSAASVAVVPGDEVQVGQQRRREVSLVAASAAEVQHHVQPFVDAGFVVRGVVTPALALAAMARAQRELSGAVAYVAMVGHATCLAIVRDGVLLFAREMPWGHEQGSGVRDQGAGEQLHAAGTPAPDSESRTPDPESLEARLTSELKRSILFFKQTFRAPVEAVALCGDMPNLRSLTAPMGEAMGMPVHTLDSLVGIDAGSLPDPPDDFRRDVASLRMAIAAGADAAPLANLLPASIVEARGRRRQIVRLVVSAAAGLVLTTGWYVVAKQTVAHQRGERDAIQRELAVLEPDVARQAQRQQAATLTSSRRTALSSFDFQGPRLARLLETVASSAPDEVMLNALNVRAEGAFWRTEIRGIAISLDAAVAQAAVNAFVGRLSASPFAGRPDVPPSRRLVSGRSAGASGDASRVVQIPPGMTGVEFSMQLKVAK